jgi:hypothetical protein
VALTEEEVVIVAAPVQTDAKTANKEAAIKH